ncbi:MAG: heme-binding beta-barrel domain-containing protein [Cyclobacteriaceae bacterium]
MKKILLALIFAPILSFGQMSKQDSVWLPFKNMVGTWTGTSEGQPGKGTYERTYQIVLNKKFIEVRNKSTYAPSKDNPKVEVHEDHGFISYDKARKTFVLRQFHIEGFVNQYKTESISPDGKTIVFISESIENIPAGFRAKETYQIISKDEFTETFELAEPGKEFEVYSKAVLKRQKK